MLCRRSNQAAKSNYGNLRDKAFQVRTTAAKVNREIPIPSHLTNGDEAKYANKIATDTRGLPHNQQVKLI